MTTVALERAASPAARTRFRTAPIGILVGALVIRCVGVAWALPYVHHPDEPVNYGVFHDMVAKHRLNPRFFAYPSLFFYVQAFVHALYTGAMKIAGRPSPGVPFIESGANGIVPGNGASLTARLVTVIAGVAVVACAMALAWVLTARRPVVVLAGVAAAVHPTLVANSRWITPDMLTALTATAAVIAAVAVARNPNRRAYVIAGVTIGLAASSKYNAALVGVALIVAHLLFARRRAGARRDLAIAAGVAVLTFLCTTPFAVFDFHAFWHGFNGELQHYRTGHAGSQGAAGATNLRWLWGSTGPLLLCAVGCFWAEKRVRRLLAVPGAFVVVYLAVVSAQRVRFERNLVPVLPALLVLATVGAVTIWDRWRTRALAAAIACVMLAWPATLTALDTRAAIRDERATARTWIVRNIPAGSSVVLEAYAPYVDPGRYRVVVFDKVLGHIDAIQNSPPDAVIVTERGSGRYANASSVLRRLRAKSCADVTFGSDGDRIEIIRLTCA